VNGTGDWTEYSITLPLHKEAKQLVFGVLMSGTGKAWADDLQLLVDGKPIWELPVVERPKTSLDLDHEFDRGSRITITDLSKVQIENLTTLGKVWASSSIITCDRFRPASLGLRALSSATAGSCGRESRLLRVRFLHKWVRNAW